MKIAICDDETAYGETLMNMIKDYPTDQNWIVELYSDGYELLMQPLCEYQLIFLDIEMPTINGMYLANQIVEINPNILIIYTTNYMAYVTKALRNHAFQFLPKPINKEDLFLELDRVQAEITKRQCKYNIFWKGKDYFLTISEILYIESNNKLVCFTMLDGRTYFTNNKLHEAAAELAKYNFSQPHKSFIVNLAHVVGVSGDEINIDNGLVIPISRSCRDEFRTAINFFNNGILI